MSLMEFGIVMGAVLVLFFIGMLLLLSEKRKGKHKKRKHIHPTKEETVNWAKIAEKNERFAMSLKKQLIDEEKKYTKLEKQLLIEQAKVKKLQEKLSQERQWHSKEETTIDKQVQALEQAKKELIKTQQMYAKEHALTLKMKREKEDLTEQVDDETKQRRQTEKENQEYQIKNDNLRQEIMQLKKEMAILNKKKEDINWIAKSEYEKLQKEIRERDEQIERLKKK